MRSTEIVFIFPKTGVHSGSNSMHPFFLPLTQVSQFEFLKSTHFLPDFTSHGKGYFGVLGLHKLIFKKNFYLSSS